MFINSMNKNLKVVITKRQLEIMKKQEASLNSFMPLQTK